MSLLKQISSLPLAFGGASISGEGGGYGFGKISELEALELLHYSYDHGVKIYDTAPVYGFGLSEQRIGKAFRHIRDKVFIVSKCGVSWHENKRINMTNEPHVAEKMLLQSLKDLQSDYIDLYMIHWPDPQVDIRKTMELLKKHQDLGKIKHLGLCNTTLDDIQKAQQVAKISVIQNEFNYFNTESKNLFPFLNHNHIDFMSWGTLDKGILSGRVTSHRKYDPEDCRSWAPWWKKSPLNEKLEKIENLQSELNKKNISLLEFALQHNLQYSEITTLICGFRNKTQLDEILKSLTAYNPSPHSNKSMN